MTSSNNSQEIEKPDQNIVINDESKTLAEKILEFVKYPVSALLFCFIFYGFLSKNDLLDKHPESWNYMEFISVAAAIAVALAVSLHSKERDLINKILYIPITLITATLIFSAVIYQISNHQSNIISLSLGVTLFFFFIVDILGGNIKINQEYRYGEKEEKDGFSPKLSQIITVPTVIIASVAYYIYIATKIENSNIFAISFFFYILTFIFLQGFILRYFLRIQILDKNTKFRTVGKGVPNPDSILLSVSLFTFLAYLPIMIFETDNNIMADSIFVIVSILFSLLILLGFYRIPPFGYLGSIIAHDIEKNSDDIQHDPRRSSEDKSIEQTKDGATNAAIDSTSTNKESTSDENSKLTQTDSLGTNTESDEQAPLHNKISPKDAPHKNKNAATAESDEAEPTTATDTSIQADEITSGKVQNSTGTEAKHEELEEYLNQLKNYLYNYNFDIEKIDYIKDILMEANVKPVQQKGEPTYFTLNSIHGRIGVLRIAPYRKNITLKIGANTRGDNETIEKYFNLKPKNSDQYNFYHDFVEYNKNYIDNSGLQREPFLIYSPGKKGKKDLFNGLNKGNLIDFIRKVDEVKWGNQTESK